MSGLARRPADRQPGYRTTPRDRLYGAVTGALLVTLCGALVLGVFAGSVGAAAAQGSGSLDRQFTQGPHDAVQGDTVTLTVEVTNTGDTEASGEVNLNIVDSSDKSVYTDYSKTVTLAAGESTIITYEWDTSGEAADDYTAWIYDGNFTSQDSTTINLAAAEPNLTRQFVKSPSDVVEGETATIDVEVTNTGNAEGTGEVNLNIVNSSDKSVYTDYSQTVTLAPGESTTITYSWNTTGLAADDYTAWVYDADFTSQDSATISVAAAEPDLNREIVDYNSTVFEGETTYIDIEITNTGNAEGSGEVNLNIVNSSDKSVYTDYSQTVTLAPGESTLIRYRWDTTGLPADDYTAWVYDADFTSQDSATISVAASEPNLTRQFVKTPSTVTAGETTYIDIEITNTGNAEGSGEVNLNIVNSSDKSVYTDYSQTVTLAPGESTLVRYRWDTTGLDPDNYTAWVYDADFTSQDSATITVTGDPTTATATATPTPAPTGTAASTSTPGESNSTSTATPTATATAPPDSTPTPDDTPTEVSTPQETSTPSPEDVQPTSTDAPGFGVGLALLAVVAAAVLATRRRR
jgi:PGF-CTERM protein/uncharacterized repeat protein (TIGR01451 family)